MRGAGLALSVAVVGLAAQAQAPCAPWLLLAPGAAPGPAGYVPPAYVLPTRGAPYRSSTQIRGAYVYGQTVNETCSSMAYQACYEPQTVWYVLGSGDSSCHWQACNNGPGGIIALASYSWPPCSSPRSCSGGGVSGRVADPLYSCPAGYQLNFDAAYDLGGGYSYGSLTMVARARTSSTEITCKLTNASLAPFPSDGACEFATTFDGGSGEATYTPVARDPDCANPCPACSDGDVCNGVETNLADGGCQAGTPLVCNDGLTCTEDLCEPTMGCVHPEAPDAIDAGACECRQAATGTFPWSFTGPRKALPTVACPSGEGTAGLEFTLSGLGALTEAGCSNGCKSTNTASGSAEASLSLCTANAVKVTGTATATHGRAHAVECDEATCGQVCSAGYCATNEAGGSLSVAVSEKVAWKKRYPTFAGVSFAIDCGHTKSLTGTVSGSQKDVVDHGAPAGRCTECTTTNLTVSAAGKVAANCKFEATAVGMKTTLGCKGCLSGEVGVAGSVSGTEGACGTTVCTGARANAKVAFESPRVESGFRWFGVSFVCRGGVTGCSEANTCGTCTCGGTACTEVKADFSCAVCTPGTTLSQCAGATAGGTL